MLHPALARALATAHTEDQLRAAARWHTIRRARRLARESRVAATSTAGQRSTSTPTHIPDDLAQARRESLSTQTS